MDRQNDASPDRYLTAQEAAKYLGYAIGTLYNKCVAGEIPHLRLGRNLRFRHADLDKWVREQNSEYPEHIPAEPAA